VAQGGSRSIDHLLGSDELLGAESCFSVLVETGVHSPGAATALDHSPRDFLPVEDGLEEPTHVVTNVLEAVDLVFSKENFR